MRDRTIVVSGLLAAGLICGCLQTSDGVMGGGATGGSTARGGGGSVAGTGGRSATGGMGTGPAAGTGGTATGGTGTGTGGRAASGGAQGTGGSGSSGTGGRTATGGSGTGSGGAATGGAVTGPGGAAASTGGAGGAVTPPPAVACSVPLASRVTIVSIAVTPKVVTKGSGINSVSLPVILSTTPNGRAKVAWSDGTNVHVTPLDEAGQRAAADVMIAGTEVRGLVAHDDGAAVLVRRADVMAFVRLNEAGAVQSMLNIVGGTSHTTEGARWIDDWPHQGRLAWSGTQYAAYFGQTGNHGSAGNHQGDQYALVTATGTKATGGWDWGCSHSLDDRIAHNGTVFAPICISDSYPGAGIFFNNRVKISDEPSVTNVGGIAKLGGIVPAPDGFWLTFTSPANRASSDIAFIKISNTGTPSGRAYLTDTAAVQEGFSHLAAYGDRLVAGWDSGNATAVSVAVIDKAGVVVEGPAVTTARIGGQDDFATFANGDVGWAGAWDDLAQVRIVRVAACK